MQLHLGRPVACECHDLRARGWAGLSVGYELQVFGTAGAGPPPPRFSSRFSSSSPYQDDSSASASFCCRGIVSKETMEHSGAQSEIIFLVEQAAEGGYTARALGHSIHTQAESLDELKAAVKDALRCHFDTQDMPRVIRLHTVQDEVIPA